MVALDRGLVVDSLLELRATERAAFERGWADSRLRPQQALPIGEPGDTGARLVMQVSRGAVAPPGLRLFRGDIADSMIIE